MLRRIGYILFSSILILSLIGCSSAEDVGEPSDASKELSQVETEIIAIVKEGTTSSYPDITYGEAFDSYFGEPVWSCTVGESEEDRTTVSFTGFCNYQDKSVSAEIDFVILDDDTSFEATSLSFDGTPQGNSVLTALLEDAFESVTDSDITQGTTEPVESDSDAEEVAPESSTDSSSEGEYVAFEYNSSKYGYISGFYVKDERASDYFVKNVESLRSFVTLDEFINYKYANLIVDFYAVSDPYPGTDTTEITLCMRDDYGWSFEDYEHIALDLMNASSMIPTAQTYYIHVYFEFFDGTSLSFDSYDYYVD